MEELKELKGTMFLTPKDIQLMTGSEIKAARREHAAIREAMEKERITIIDYCEYWKSNLQYAIICLNKNR